MAPQAELSDVVQWPHKPLFALQWQDVTAVHPQRERLQLRGQVELRESEFADPFLKAVLEQPYHPPARLPIPQPRPWAKLPQQQTRRRSFVVAALSAVLPVKRFLEVTKKDK